MTGVTDVSGITELNGIAEMSHDTVSAHLYQLFDGWGALSPEHARLRERVLGSFQALVNSRKVCTDLASEKMCQDFIDTHISEDPCTLDAYTDFLTDTVVTHSINMSSPRCLGHMTAMSPSFIRVLSELVVCMNQNLVKCDASKVVTLIERQILATLHRLVFQKQEDFYRQCLSHNDDTLGIMTSGGTLANLTALWCARNAVFSPQQDFKGVEEDGISAALEYYQYQKAVVIGSELMHYSIDKAAAVLGLGARSMIKVPVDNNNQMNIDALEAVVEQCKSMRWRIIAVVGVAGTTDCGSVDPLNHIAEIAAREKVHFHVDAAWGGPLLLSSRHRSKLDGIHRADSVTIDGHKQLYLPIGAGMLLLRDPKAAKVLERQAHYILQEDSADLGKYSIEGSRTATALFVHAALNLIGRKCYERMLDDNIRKAAIMANLIEDSDEFELLMQPETNIVLYRYVPLGGHRMGSREDWWLTAEYLNKLNQSIQSAQYKRGRTFVSRTTLMHLPRYPGQSVLALRAVITNPLTIIDDMKAVLEDQMEFGRAIVEQTECGCNA